MNPEPINDEVVALAALPPPLVEREREREREREKERGRERDKGYDKCKG